MVLDSLNGISPLCVVTTFYGNIIHKADNVPLCPCSDMWNNVPEIVLRFLLCNILELYHDIVPWVGSSKYFFHAARFYSGFVSPRTKRITNLLKYCKEFRSLNICKYIIFLIIGRNNYNLNSNSHCWKFN